MTIVKILVFKDGLRNIKCIEMNEKEVFSSSETKAHICEEVYLCTELFYYYFY